MTSDDFKNYKKREAINFVVIVKFPFEHRDICKRNKTCLVNVLFYSTKPLF